MKITLELRPVLDLTKTIKTRWGEEVHPVSKFETVVVISATVLHSYPNCGTADSHSIEGVGKTFDDAKKDFDDNLSDLVNRTSYLNDGDVNVYSYTFRG